VPCRKFIVRALLASTDRPVTLDAERPRRLAVGGFNLDGGPTPGTRSRFGILKRRLPTEPPEDGPLLA
jgi:hypothetical protein